MKAKQCVVTHVDRYKKRFLTPSSRAEAAQLSHKRRSPSPVNNAQSALDRAEWQAVLFNTPNRAELVACVPRWACRTVRVRVHRNHGFEPVSSGTSAYAAWNRFALDWSIGAYDDSLSLRLQDDADVEVIWLDRGRIVSLAAEELGNWLVGRLRALRLVTTNPILVLAWPLSLADQRIIADAAIPGVHVADLEPLASQLGNDWLDPRAEAISGTRLSNRACLEVARKLACCWLPAAVTSSSARAIAIDLDETLYRGVLGEDGPAGVELTPGHRALQERLVRFRREGGLLALVSRNEPQDVEQLFACRSDFPLRFGDFSIVEASWGDKAVALERVARRLRIGTDTIVFVDDNPGELSTVATSTSAITVHARRDGAETEAALAHVAGIFRWRGSHEDHLRANDLRAAETRGAVARDAVSPDEYLRSLRVRLGYIIGARAELPRVAELVSKTNQFNLSLRRSNEAQIARRLDERSSNVIAIRLSDRLSDSGIVAVLVGSREGDTLRVEELCVSCRALGRHLEDCMLTQALLFLAGETPPRHVAFELRKGPRNEPARRWLAQYADVTITDEVDQVEMTFQAIVAKPLSSNIGTEVTR
jgi:FkbH-like protein